ncbi:mucin TcMUC [Trypanosoma cruzi]|uniref:Mucin TcMUC n=1 Tax=Trypanosoma cruzi TaxID=5693 RepID=A0A7J6XTI6_TRYCR|nr:mucin TcMUC [Trypanosoma cruzi]
MDQALPPPPHHRRHGLLIPRRTTGDSASSTAGMPSLLGTGTATVWDCPSPHDGPFATEYLPLLYGRPLRYSLVIVAAYNQNRITSCFVMNIGCTSRGPTIRVVCGDLLFLLLLCFCVAVCAAPSCVCVRTLREGCRHDGPLSPYVHAVEPCVPLLFASPSSICVCWCCGRAVCVCVPAAVDWSVCRAWCAAYGACLAAALSSCGVSSACVCRTSRLPCCSPCPSLCRSAPHH